MIVAGRIIAMNKLADVTKYDPVIKDISDLGALQRCLYKLVEWTITQGMDFSVKSAK